MIQPDYPRTSILKVALPVLAVVLLWSVGNPATSVLAVIFLALAIAGIITSLLDYQYQVDGIEPVGDGFWTTLDAKK